MDVEELVVVQRARAEAAAAEEAARIQDQERQDLADYRADLIPAPANLAELEAKYTPTPIQQHQIDMYQEYRALYGNPPAQSAWLAAPQNADFDHGLGVQLAAQFPPAYLDSLTVAKLEVHDYLQTLQPQHRQLATHYNVADLQTLADDTERNPYQDSFPDRIVTVQEEGAQLVADVIMDISYATPPGVGERMGEGMTQLTALLPDDPITNPDLMKLALGIESMHHGPCYLGTGPGFR